MENEDKSKNQRPYKMINIAFPKAKYGFYLAIFIVIVVLLFNLQRFDIVDNKFYGERFVKNSKTKKN
tara:strand:+ start:460 stop:660 length:201 start_codon:yes stop_codon:yes gene_type:complete